MTTLLAIDQGTTSSRAILFSEKGDTLKTKQKELTLHYPHKGWVEQDGEDIWQDTLWCVQQILKETDASDIASIGITNQRETTILWDRNTGKPVYNAIVWQDRRTAEYCHSLKEEVHETNVQSKTGLLLDPYFSATKVKWILNNVEGAKAKAEAGELCFGTVDSFLLWRLTGGKVHATDATNASRTMLYNIQTGEWDNDLLELFDIPISIMPEVRDNVSDFGVTQKEAVGAEIPIGGIAGDQQAALIGQACFDKGMVKSTYGTGCFVLMNVGETFVQSENKLLTTIGYQFDGKVTYALEGSIFVAGAAIQWLRDNLNLIESADESETLAHSVPDSNEVYFIPAFTGLGAPYWKPDARAAILGLSRESNRAHIVRAALEAQAYQTKDLMQAFQDDAKIEIGSIRVDGGLVQNQFVCQLLADMLDCPIDVPKVTETTALGAAYLAGLSVGFFSNLDDIQKAWQVDKNYTSQIDDGKRNSLYQGWQSSIQSIL